MSKSFRLQPILELAEREAEKSALRLGTLHAQAAQLELKLQLLQRYREEYLERFRRSLRENPRNLPFGNFHEFMDKLDTAIRQQQATVEQAREQVAAGQREHLDRRRRVQAFGTLAERHRSAAQLQERRAEQRALDEITSQRGSRKARSA
jgi:flagellar FliJ protein